MKPQARKMPHAEAPVHRAPRCLLGHAGVPERAAGGKRERATRCRVARSDEALCLRSESPRPASRLQGHAASVSSLPEVTLAPPERANCLRFTLPACA